MTGAPTALAAPPAPLEALPPAERSAAVRRMFDRVAARYDLVNTVLSVGVHHAWRRAAVAELAPPLGAQALDACCGTGDLTLLLAKSVGPGGAVLGTDFSEAMLERARQKVSNSNVEFAIADLLSLPLASGRFDVASLAFGIRNVVDPVAGLRELRRVLRPAGRLLVLEFGQPRNPALASLWAAFSRSVLPRLGGALSGEPAAYEYLPRTSLAFPCGDRFVDGVLRRAGFTPIRTRALWGGIAWIYIGGKP